MGMVQAGTQLTGLGNTKGRLLFRRTAAETAEGVLEIEASYPPHGGFPPLHRHPEQDEHFTVLAGALSVRIGERERRYQAGEAFSVPCGTPHTMCNPADEIARVRWETRPALRTAEFYAALYDLEGNPAVRGPLRALRLLLLARRYRREMVLTRLPLLAQRLLFGALAPLALLLDRDSSPSAHAAQGRYTIHERIAIARLPVEAFAYIANYAHDPLWRGAVVEMRQDTPGEAAVGTITREVVRALGQRIATTARIVAYEPGQRIAFASITGPIPVEGYRAVAAATTGAEVTFALTAELRGLYRLIASLLVGSFQRGVRADLLRLKALLEGGASDPAR